MSLHRPLLSRLLILILSLATLVNENCRAAIGDRVATISRQAKQLIADPARPRVYATTSLNTVIAIDTGTLTIAGEIVIGSNPEGLDISQDGTRLYVACSGTTTAGIGVIDLTTWTKLPSLATPFAPWDVAAGLNGRLYILGTNISQIDSTTGAVQASIGGYTSSGPYVDIYGGRLAINPARDTLFYGDTGLSPASLYRFDVSTGITLSQESNFSELGSNGQDVIVNHAGTALCYATGSGQGSYGTRLIPVGNLNGSLGLFDTDAYPTNGAFSPDDTRFYAAPDTQNTVKIFDTNTFVMVGSFPISTTYGWRDVFALTTDRTGRNLYAAMEDQLEVYAVSNANTPTITSALAVNAHRGESFTYTATCNTAGVTFSATDLPQGLSIDAVTGVISGTPALAGNYSVALHVSASNGTTGGATLALSVQTPFTVQTSGTGTVTAGFAGTTWRTIGSAFQITAMAGSGYAFEKWTGSITSSSATISGQVTADMTLTASFLPKVDLQLTVVGNGSVNPVAAGTTAHVVGEQLTLTATPAVGMRFVGWSGSLTSDSATLTFTMTDDVTLVATFEPVDAVHILIGSAGPGLVTPRLAGDTAHAKGEIVTVTATPFRGARFLTWVGSVVSAQPTLTFTAEPGFNVYAVFESLDEFAGTYQLQTEPDASGITSVNMTLTLTPVGTFTAVVFFDGKRMPLAGSLAPLSGFSVALPRPVGGVLLLNLALGREGALPVIAGTAAMGSDPIAISGARVEKFTADAPASQAGQYHWGMLRGAAPEAPGGNGFGNLRVSKNGAVSLSGVLGDGTVVGAGSALLEDQSVMIRAPLYRNRGVIEGRIYFRDVPAWSDFDGTLSWKRPAKPSAASYTAGFTTMVPLVGSRHYALPASENVFTSPTGVVSFVEGGLTSTAATTVTFAARNLVQTQPDAHGLRLALTPKSGTFTGSFIMPGARRTNFRGTILSKSQRAMGTFMSGPVFGAVVLETRFVSKPQ